MPNSIRVQYPVNSLISYHYNRNRDLTKMINNQMFLIGDSGAFSAATQGARINLDEFGTWGNKWKNQLAWIASLDVIGDPEETFKNYRYLRTQHSLNVIPTIHFGADPKVLDRYADDGVDFVGLGGMVAHKTNAMKLLRWTIKCFKYARDNHPTMRFHGWGVTHKELLFQLPWYSVDSTGWAYSFMMGRHKLFNPSTADFVQFSADGIAAFQHTDLIRQHYGIEPAKIAKCSPRNMDEVVRLSARSYQLLEQHLQTRNTVKKPTYGLHPKAVDGINIHLANGSSSVFEKHLRPLKEDLGEQ